MYTLCCCCWCRWYVYTPWDILYILYQYLYIYRFYVYFLYVCIQRFRALVFRHGFLCRLLPPCSRCLYAVDWLQLGKIFSIFPQNAEYRAPANISMLLRHCYPKNKPGRHIAPNALRSLAALSSSLVFSLFLSLSLALVCIWIVRSLSFVARVLLTCATAWERGRAEGGKGATWSGARATASWCVKRDRVEITLVCVFRDRFVYNRVRT